MGFGEARAEEKWCKEEEIGCSHWDELRCIKCGDDDG